MRHIFFFPVMLMVAVFSFSCDFLNNDGGPEGITPGGYGYFYLLDRDAISLIMLGPALHELKRWSMLRYVDNGIDPVNGDALQGITSDGQYLWISVSRPMYKIYQIKPIGDSLITMAEMDAPPASGSRGTVRGISWDRSSSSLWVLNSGSTGNFGAKLYRYNPATQTVMDTLSLPTYDPRGLTYVPTASDVYGRGASIGVYYTDVTKKKIYKYMLDKLQFDTAFNAPVPPRGIYNIYPTGITYDGTYFYLLNSSGTADHLYCLDYTGKEKSRFDIPYSSPSGIVWTTLDVRPPAPVSLIACVQSFAKPGVTTTIQVYGKGFAQGSGLWVTFGDSVKTLSVTYSSPTLLQANVSISSTAPLGKRLVTVTLPDGRTASDSLFEVSVKTQYIFMADQATNTLNKIQISNASLVKSWTTTTIAAGSPQGVAHDGTNFWVCISGTDKKIYKIDTTSGSLVPSTYFSPGGLATTGTLRGITFYDNAIWLCVSTVGRIYKLDPTNGAVLDSLPTPGTEPRGITFVNGYLYCNDTNIDYVHIWDNGSRTWTQVLQTPIPVGSAASRFATGMTWDGTAFWLANSSGTSDFLFQIAPDGTMLQSFRAPLAGDPQITGLVYIIQ